MSTKRTTQKGETAADIGSTRTKKPKKKKETNNETEAASTRTKKPKKKKDTTKKEADDNNNNNDEREKEKEAKSNRNDSFSTEAKIAMKQFTYQIVQAGLHQLRVQFNELKAFVPADPSKKHFDANATKCRYKDVPCWDKTRIVLSWPSGSANDFIHANRITHELLEAQQLICCQGPLADTVADMWRCVWQEKVKQIIMLCCCQELGKDKCAQYWPSTVGEKMTFHGLTIKCDKIDATDRSFVHTKLSLTFDGKTRTLDHRQWTTWPDKSVPKTPMAPFRLLQYTRKSPKNPTIIHCSAGIGRTGTLVMIEMMYKSLVKGKIPDVPQLVKDVRAQRAMAVQTEDQYLYCHYAILQLLHIKKIAPSHFIKHFIREYENYLKLLNDVGGKNLPMQATSLPQPCANCSKVAAHMNDAKPAADSPPSESRNEKKEESKRENAGGKNDEKTPDRKANLLKQLKTQKEKKRGKKEKTVDEQIPEQTPHTPSPIPVETANQGAIPTEEAKAPESPIQHQNQNNNNIVQPPPVVPQAPPSPIQPEEPPHCHNQVPQPQIHSAFPSPAPPPPQPQIQQPPMQQQQQQQYPAAFEPQQPVQPFQQQQIPQCPPPLEIQQQQQQAVPQKFQYTPAPTYTVQQAGNEKAIVYHRNANQPFIKAIASPAGIPQPMCLVQANIPPCQQQQQPPQPQQNQNQPGVPFQQQQQF